MIRNGIKDKKNIRPLLTKEVWEYLDEMNFYKK
jgi:nicotinate-nucleotide adenylyltransferase